MLAQFRSAYESGAAQFRSAYADTASPEIPAINAERACVKNLRTGQVYYEKGASGADSRIASMTKVLLAHVLLQRYPTEADLLARSVTIVSSDLSAGGSGANIQVDDVFTLHALLMNALLPSSNNSCMAIARIVGQEMLDEEEATGDPRTRYLNAMRAMATSLGMASLSITNVHGYTNYNVCTAQDLTLLSDAAWESALFRRAVGTKTYDVPVVRDGTPTTIAVVNTNPVQDWPGVLGGKTGSLSGSSPLYNVMVWFEAPNGDTLAVVVQAAKSSAQRQTDAETLLTQVLIDFPELSSSIGMNADAQASVHAGGALATSVDFAAASLIATTATGSLTTGIALQGAASSMTLAEGVLTVQIRLRGDALSSAIAAAGLTTAIQLAAAAQAGAQATGDLTAPGSPASLEGHAQAAALAAGSITTIIRLDAAAVAAVVGTGTLTAPGAPSQLAADATVLAIASGGLTTAIALQGAAASVVQASGTLDIALTFEAAAFASAMASGVLSTQVRMDAAAVAAAIASASLTTSGAPLAAHGARSAMHRGRQVVSARRPAQTITIRRARQWA